MRPTYIILLLHWFVVLGWVASALPDTFEDSIGRRITLERPPQRIVSLAPSITEILYFLGLGDRVAGVTRFSTFPKQAKLKPKVGSYINVNVEKIITLSPDLVIGTVDGNRPAVVAMLEQAGIEVFIVNPRDIRQVTETIKTLGLVCGVPERADRLFRELSGRVDRIVGKTRARKRPLVFLQINLRPIMTVNKDTYLHDLIDLAGGINMGQDASVPYPRIGLEEVLKRKPEVIIISSMERGGRFEKARREWFKWKSIPAVRDGRVHLIDSDLIDRPSPRIVEGLEILARLIHPELAWE